MLFAAQAGRSLEKPNERPHGAQVPPAVLAGVFGPAGDPADPLFDYSSRQATTSGSAQKRLGQTTTLLSRHSPAAAMARSKRQLHSPAQVAAFEREVHRVLATIETHMRRKSPKKVARIKAARQARRRKRS
jgi:hypothetical protein